MSVIEHDIYVPELHAGQRSVTLEAARFNVIAAGRRWGKNTLAEERLIEIALSGKPVAWFSPTYKTLAEDWRRVSDILLPATEERNEQERRIKVWGGGVVEMWSLDSPDTARGRAYARVVIDEAASVPKLMYAWQQVIRPMLTDYSGDAWFISTPNGWNEFYDLWRWGQDAKRPEWRSWRRPSAENPHLPPEDLVQAERDLPSVVWRQEYLAEFLAGGIGQFFSEWDPNLHTCEMGDIPKTWRRFGMLDYGYVAPFCYLQAAIGPDGQCIVYREIYDAKVLDSQQAERIAAACQGDVPEYIVAGPDLWHASGKGILGQSTAETYQQVWRKLNFVTQLRRAADDREMGWRRVHEWLRPLTASDGHSWTARLRIVGERCPQLVRTLPSLTHSESHPEDVDSDGEDHAPDALRYGLMSRPAPKVPPKLNPPGDFDAGELMKQVMERQKRARFIGHEREWEALVGRRKDGW